jgi:hypothetical protein
MGVMRLSFLFPMMVVVTWDHGHAPQIYGVQAASAAAHNGVITSDENDEMT